MLDVLQLLLDYLGLHRLHSIHIYEFIIYSLFYFILELITIINMGGLKDFLTEKEVADYMQDTGKKYIIFEGSVYDVTDYIGVHPGGTDKIEPLVGQNID